MNNATSYPDWAAAARAFDEAGGAARWRKEESSPAFDTASVRRRLDTIRSLLAASDDRALLFVLNEGVHGNMDGIGNGGLWGQAKFGTKQLVEEYMEALAACLLYTSPSPRD